MMSIYRFQFQYYVYPGQFSSLESLVDVMTGFDDIDEAKEFAESQNKKLPDPTKGADLYTVLGSPSIKKLPEKSVIFKAAVECDLKAGRLCSYDLNSFVKKAFGKKCIFASFQGVDPAMITQWNNKNRMITYTQERGWVLSFERRPIVFE